MPDAGSTEVTGDTDDEDRGEEPSGEPADGTTEEDDEPEAVAAPTRPTIGGSPEAGREGPINPDGSPGAGDDTAAAAVR